jgi:hypothetical protein
MDRELFCKTFVFGLNTNRIQMNLFQRENRKEKGEKTKKLEKGLREPFQPRPRRCPRPSNPLPEPLPFPSLSDAWAPHVSTTSSSSPEHASFTGA